MNLDDLDDLIDGLGIDPKLEELKRIFMEFKKDFLDDELTIDGLKVKVIIKYSSEKEYETLPETFVHLITTKSSTGKRVFDKFRANKIHWIRSILENRDDDRILYFEYLERPGDIRDYYWYKEGNFVVVLKKIRPDYLIITSFFIDNVNKVKDFENRYRMFKTKNK